MRDFLNYYCLQLKSSQRLILDMFEAKKGFLGLTTTEWRRALSTGGLSLVFEKDDENAQALQPRELSHAEQVAKAKDLGRVILTAKTELENLPREALIESAWQAVAHYQVQGTTWGYDSEGVKAFEKEKELRLSLLTDEEFTQAIFLANDWLNDNFDK